MSAIYIPGDEVTFENPLASADILEITNQDVTVTATFSDDTVTKQYSYDRETWETYTDPIVFEENNTIHFRGINAAGETSQITTLSVSNIDKVAPDAPSADINAAETFDGVLVTANFSDDTVTKQFSRDGQTWEDYTEALAFTENTTVYFRGIDAAGNISETTEYAVDLSAVIIVIESPVAAASTTELTNQDVTVSATFSNNSTVRQYSYDQEEWFDYTEALVFDENNTVYFRGGDGKGNFSEVVSFTVENIDKVAPDAPIASSDAAATFEGVLVSAVFSDDSVTKQYSLDGETWEDYTDAIPFTENGTVWFRSYDAAGNISKVTPFIVSSFESSSVAAPQVDADITDLTNQDVTLTAVFGDDIVTKQFSYDLITWNDYEGPVVVEENQTVYFRGANEAGEFSDVVTFPVENIDKVAPDAPTASSGPSPAVGIILVTAVFSDDSVTKQFSTDGETWEHYTDALPFSENGTVYFRGIDAAGNVSEVATFVVDSFGGGEETFLTVTSSTTDPTNQDVTLTVTFGGYIVTAFYQDPADPDTTYEIVNGGTVVFSENGTLTVFGYNSDGSSLLLETTFTVDNIDKVAPDAPTASSDAAVGAEGVLVSAVFSDDSVSKQFSSDGENWEDYTEALAFTENGTVWFRGIDAAGNISEVTEFVVDSFGGDETFLTVTPSTTDPTNQDVVLTVTFGGDIKVAFYTDPFDPSTAIEILNGGTFTFSENGSLTVKGYESYDGAALKETTFSVENIDKVPPEAPTAVSNEAEEGVLVSATFSEDSVTKQFSRDGETWEDYADALSFTENGTVYFRGIDAAGNVSDTLQYEVVIIVIDPPFVAASTTELTNQDVTVTATFGDDATVRQFSYDQVEWNDYSEALVFDENKTVYFRAGDDAGHFSEVVTFAVENIDKVAPEKPTLVSAEFTDDTKKAMTVIAAFSEDSATKEYSRNGQTWEAYPEGGVSVDSNITIYFRGIDAAGNVSETFGYEVTGFVLLNGPDDGWNNWLYDKNNGENAELVNMEVAPLTYDSTIVLDKPGTVLDPNTGYHNFVGSVEGFQPKDRDEADYTKIVLETGAQLQFSIDSQITGKFIIYSYDASSKKMKALVTTKLTVKNNTPVKDVTSTAKLLEAGTYYISMQGTLPKAGKGWAPNGFYDVELTSAAHFFLDDDDNKNNWLYEGGKNGRGLNNDVAGASVVAKDLSRASKGELVQIDADVVEHDPTGKFNNFVGFGDTVDYVKIHLDTAANLVLTLESNKAAKIQIYTLTTKDGVANGSKALVTTALKAGNGTIATKAKVLDAGDYYIAVTSTNAKKGDEAYYNVKVNDQSVFFDNIDDGTNNWLYEGGKNGRGANTTLINSTGITLVDSLTNIQIDANVPTGEEGGWKNFVGYGDPDDYQKIVVSKAGATASFKVDAKDQAKFVIYSYDKATNKMKALQTSKLKKIGDNNYSITTATYTFKTAGEYYIAVTSTNAKKGGNAYYNVTLASTSITAADLVNSDALAMPETSSGLNQTDDLSFAQNDAAVLAGASVASLADLDDKSAWQNITTLA